MVPIDILKAADYNPRQAQQKDVDDLRKSIEKYGVVDPIIVNGSKERKNIIIGGHFRVKVAKDMGIIEVPVVYVDIPDLKREQELNLRLNKNIGKWNYDLLANFDEEMLEGSELDIVFDLETNPEDDFNPEVEFVMGFMTQMKEHLKQGGVFTYAVGTPHIQYFYTQSRL
jgi:ParB-like chromosome segregation protein Spo0J